MNMALIADTTNAAEQIRQLYARYAHSVDEGRFEDWADLWTADGVFEATGMGTFVGRENMIAMLADFRRGLEGKVEQILDKYKDRVHP